MRMIDQHVREMLDNARLAAAGFAPPPPPRRGYAAQWLEDYDHEHVIQRYRDLPRPEAWVNIGRLSDAVMLDPAEDYPRHFTTIPWKDPEPITFELTMDVMQRTLCLLWGGHAETYLDLHGDERCSRCEEVQAWVLGSE